MTIRNESVRVIGKVEAEVKRKGPIKGYCRDKDRDGRFKRVFAPISEWHYIQRSNCIYERGSRNLLRKMCRNSKPRMHEE